MALTPLLTFTSVSADGSTSLLTDATVYGGANPVRGDIATAVKAYKVDEDLVETALTIVASPTDPLSSTTWTLTNDVDGWYKFYMTLVPLWKVGTTYNRYDLAYLTGVYYQYIFATPTAGNAVTNATYWSVVTDPATIIANAGTSTQSNNLIYLVSGKIIDYQTAACYGNVAILAAKDSCADDCNCSSGLCKSRSRIRTLLSVMRIDDTRQQYLEGEKAAREAENYCTDCGCLTQ